MNTNNKSYVNWESLDLFTKEFKEWIWKLIRKIHSRISHVEEEMATKKQVAIVVQDLSTAIEISGSTIKEIVGESDKLERPNDNFVAVNAIQEGGLVCLDSSVQMSKDVSTELLPEGYISDPASGVASDKFVKDYVASTLAWEIINN